MMICREMSPEHLPFHTADNQTHAVFIGDKAERLQNFQMQISFGSVLRSTTLRGSGLHETVSHKGNAFVLEGLTSLMRWKLEKLNEAKCEHFFLFTTYSHDTTAQ